MRKRPSKQVSNRIHARKRGNERYGIDLTKTLQHRIVNNIRHGRTVRLAKLSLTRSLHLVELDGVTMKVIYDKLRKGLVTVLPLESRDTGPGESD